MVNLKRSQRHMGEGEKSRFYVTYSWKNGIKGDSIAVEMLFRIPEVPIKCLDSGHSSTSDYIFC